MDRGVDGRCFQNCHLMRRTGVKSFYLSRIVCDVPSFQSQYRIVPHPLKSKKVYCSLAGFRVSGLIFGTAWRLRSLRRSMLKETPNNPK